MRHLLCGSCLSTHYIRLPNCWGMCHSVGSPLSCLLNILGLVPKTSFILFIPVNVLQQQWERCQRSRTCFVVLRSIPLLVYLSASVWTQVYKHVQESWYWLNLTLKPWFRIHSWSCTFGYGCPQPVVQISELFQLQNWDAGKQEYQLMIAFAPHSPW